MPTLTSVADAIALDDEVIVMNIRGKLTKLFARKSGTNSNGEWSLQNGELTGAEGQSIKLQFAGREAIPMNWKGKTVQFSSVKGEKHGWTGVKKVTDTYKDENKPMLKITATAEVIDFEAEAQAEDSGEANANPPKAPRPAQQSAPSASEQHQTSKASTQQQSASHDDPSATPLDKAIEGMTQIVNCQLTAMVMWRDYGSKYLEGRGFTQLDPIQMSTLVNATVIQMERERWHLNFPKKRFTIGGNGGKPKQAPPTAKTDVSVDEDNIPY